MATIQKGAQSAQSTAHGSSTGSTQASPYTANRPKAAFILMLIGGIMILLYAVLILLGGLAAVSLAGKVTGNTLVIGNTTLTLNQTEITALKNAPSTLYPTGGIGIVAGLVVIVMAFMMWKTGDIKRMHNLSIIALIASIASFFGGAGFLYLGMGLAIIGSVLGMLYKG
ncbi:MAG: hypothetical protein M1158_00655 [Candidatus Marsarchaeota archaeon]|nr:hypothetical protein [Candidatus Marsarchaeota archaeon]